MTALLDTSIVVRYLVDDPPELADISTAIIESSEELAITDLAIAEVAWVLSTYYSLPRRTVVDVLTALLERENIDTFRIEKSLIIQALQLCRPSGRVSFPDALIWAAARSAGGATVYSLDRRFPSDGIEVRSAPSD